ncbi:MAG: histidine phosphatase family protein [Methylomonas sp.]|nr:histidine phosphatase family protein [Methylomonas sp.]PPD21026.1 MAG: histidine phosphatase family protein [Methylomonas sp.]PPD27053.1 MAG: histidine phosphatase family protein [Methylomonas sp.]PPD38986.1 MAG: histidine phosphatase family protein [Methylomonas sp.]PPD40894.1 MAG: histidine phosphatase family protein [Methylomonas sp.]
MLIHCLRHATAELQCITRADTERALIKKGHNQVLRVAEFCRKNGLMPSVLYSSPLLRAQQTASLLQHHLPDCPPPGLVDWLMPDASCSAIIAELRTLAAADVDNVWLVGHEPVLSNLLGELLASDGQRFNIKKASLTCIDVQFSLGPTPVAQLQWSVPCALMR